MCWKKFGDFGVIFGVKIPNAWKYKIYLRVAGRGIFWVILEGFRRICRVFYSYGLQCRFCEFDLLGGLECVRLRDTSFYKSNKKQKVCFLVLRTELFF